MENTKINPDIERRKMYQSMIPHGAQSEIARKLNVTPASVNNFLYGRTNSYRIEKAILEMIARIRIEREELLKKAGFCDE